jgi:mutual gliding-motility protein MglA
MVQINFALKEVNCKIVYYGPGLSGKTTNLEVVHLKAPEANKGELTSIATEGDRTLFFDYMPLDLGNIAGMRTKFQLYTVPGQVYYNSTRKLVLQGVDGIIFVADSQADKMEENLESLENLRNNLAEAGKDLETIAMLMQYNKRDLPNALDIDTLNQHLNPRGLRHFEAVANTGEGVFPTLKALSSLVLANLSNQRTGSTSRPIAKKKPEPVAAAAAQPQPAAQAGTSAPAGPAPQAAAQAPHAPATPPPTMPQPMPQPKPRPTPPPATARAPSRPVRSPGPSKGGGSQPPAPAETQPQRPQARESRIPQAAPPRRTPTRVPPNMDTRQGQVQQISIGRSPGRVLALIALGIITFGALGIILYSFGVL